MRKVLETESTLTDRYQTTIPEPIRAALHLGKRDKITYVIEDSGKVVISRSNENDPVLFQFLTLLVKDTKINKNIHSINPTLLHRAQSLVSGIEIDLDALLSEKDE
ncbi:MAG TPA: type II toxin-antitoxin system PrlF family antitoxin [Gammaproteobacteria bacterium]|nr:type II toxin-antitoxin system PrlF family antitoxin [Gammaproteobacteria bacterium]